MALPVETDWEALPYSLRADGITNKLITPNGRVWHLTGPYAGAEGVMINGSIDGLGSTPGSGVWSETANSAPRFERWVDGRAEIAFRALVIEDTGFGWFATRRRFFDSVSHTQPSWWAVSSRRWGEVWVPVLLDSEKIIYEDDPTNGGDNFSQHDVVLAVSGEPRWRRPDYPAVWTNDAGANVGSIRVINRGSISSWAYFICEGGGTVTLPDGPNAIIVDPADADVDKPGPIGMFTRGETIGRGLRMRRDTVTVINEKLGADEHTLFDTDPTHRIAISDTDPVDNGWLQFIRNSELLSLIMNNSGDSGLKVIERLNGQGFAVPIPPRCEATFPVGHTKAGASIWCVVPQRFDHAF